MASARHVKHTHASVTKRAQAEYDALDRIVRRLRPADFDRYVFDERARIRWTVKDVIAHLTAWKLRDVRRITGERRPLEPYDAPFGPGGAELPLPQLTNAGEEQGRNPHITIELDGTSARDSSCSARNKVAGSKLSRGSLRRCTPLSRAHAHK